MEPPLKKQATAPTPCCEYASEQLEQYLPRELARFVANTYYYPYHQMVSSDHTTGKLYEHVILYPCCEDCKTVAKVRFATPSTISGTPGTDDYHYQMTFRRKAVGKNCARSITIFDRPVTVSLDDNYGVLYIASRDYTLQGPGISEFVKFALQKVEEEVAKEKESSESPK